MAALVPSIAFGAAMALIYGVMIRLMVVSVSRTPDGSGGAFDLRFEFIALAMGFVVGSFQYRRIRRRMRGEWGRSRHAGPIENFVTSGELDDIRFGKTTPARLKAVRRIHRLTATMPLLMIPLVGLIPLAPLTSRGNADGSVPWGMIGPDVILGVFVVTVVLFVSRQSAEDLIWTSGIEEGYPRPQQPGGSLP